MGITSPNQLQGTSLNHYNITFSFLLTINQDDGWIPKGIPFGYKRL